MIRALSAAIVLVCGVGRPYGAPPAKVARSIANPEMRAFDDLVGEMGKDQPLAGLRVGGVQHMLGTTGGLLHGLAASGAHPHEMLFIGKTYSQHAGVMDALEQEGYRVHSSDFESSLDVRFGAFGPSTGSAKNRPAELLNRLDEFFELKDVRALEKLRAEVRAGKAPAGRKYLLLDDGGELIELVHKHFPELHDRIVAVEQTTRGRNKVAALDLEFPVIDVAGSEAKRVYESPMIGLSVAKTTVAKLASLSARGVQIGKRAVVIGFGAVGRATAEALRAQGYDVQITDQSDEARRSAEAAGFAVAPSLEAALTGAHLVVGATGGIALDSQALGRLASGAVVVNASSSTSEFVPKLGELIHGWDTRLWPHQEGQHLVTSFLGKRFVMGEAGAMGSAPARQDWVVRLDPANHDAAPRSGIRFVDTSKPRPPAKEIILVNQGQVINFDGDVDPIPPRYIQLTRGLLYIAAVQAARLPSGPHAPKGLVELDPQAQKKWVGMVEADLARTGESLLHPRF